MDDTSGRWYPFKASMDTIMCLEKGRDLPDHLKQIPSIETPVPLKMIISELEDSGEAWVYSNSIVFFFGLWRDFLLPTTNRGKHQDQPPHLG